MNSLYRIVLLLIFMLTIYMSTTTLAFANQLELEVSESTNGFYVNNRGECIIYKLSVETVPIRREKGFMNDLINAISSKGFFLKIGKLQNGHSIFVKKSDMTNSEGRIFTNEYKIRGLDFKGSTCGECGLSRFVPIK